MYLLTVYARSTTNKIGEYFSTNQNEDLSKYPDKILHNNAITMSSSEAYALLPSTSTHLLQYVLSAFLAAYCSDSACTITAYANTLYLKCCAAAGTAKARAHPLTHRRGYCMRMCVFSLAIMLNYIVLRPCDARQAGWMADQRTLLAGVSVSAHSI